MTWLCIIVDAPKMSRFNSDLLSRFFLEVGPKVTGCLERMSMLQKNALGIRKLGQVCPDSRVYIDFVLDPRSVDILYRFSR
jgi:hypothetical protein